MGLKDLYVQLSLDSSTITPLSDTVALAQTLQELISSPLRDFSTESILENNDRYYFSKVQVNQVVFRFSSPEFVQEEDHLFVDFLETYYQSQEYQGSNIDIVQNFNDYQKVETFSGNENLIGFTTCI